MYVCLFIIIIIYIDQSLQGKGLLCKIVIVISKSVCMVASLVGIFLVNGTRSLNCHQPNLGTISLLIIGTHSVNVCMYVCMYVSTFVYEYTCVCNRYVEL